jgi:UDP-glucose 4-epimerase
MRIAVTGGSGFIGSNLVDALAAAGHDVVVVDRRPPHRADLTYRSADLLDQTAINRALRGCDVVFHLAAVSNVNEAAEHPVLTLDINVTGTARVWEAARRNDLQRAVLASTVWVYDGARGTGPVDEDAAFDLPSAGHIYTSSKIAAELVVHNYAQLYGQPFTILRYGIPFGPRMREELVIPRFLRMARDGQSITVHGDGSQARNWVYIDDLVEAHLLALGDRAVNQVINLEGAEAVSVRQLAETIQELLDRPVAIAFGPGRAGDYSGREVSRTKAETILGWKAHTSFREGLHRYLAWYLDQDDPASERARRG